MAGKGKIKILGLLKKGAGLMAMAGGFPGVGAAMLKSPTMGGDDGPMPPGSEPSPVPTIDTSKTLTENEDFKNRQRASTGAV